MNDETTQQEQADGATVTDISEAKGKKAKRGKKPKAEAAPGGAEVPVEKKPRKGKQTQIPGTERNDRIPEIEDAAAAYVGVRDRRMELTKQEVAAREVLRAAMKKHELRVYECDGEDLTVELIPAEAEKIKVKWREPEDDIDAEGL